MGEHESIFNLTYEERAYLAGHELYSFIAAVTELYGSAQARLSEKDWLEELELMNSPPSSAKRHWRAVTIVASVKAGRPIEQRPVRSSEMLTN